MGGTAGGGLRKFKKYMKENIVNLEISSFVGLSVGASHYYGKLCFNEERVDLERRLNKRNIGDFAKEKYALGGTTARFNSEEHVIQTAKRAWKKIFPNAVILLVGSSAVLDPQKCIDGPPDLKKKINDYYRRAEKVGGYEGNDKEMTKISNEYMEEILRRK